MAPPPVPKPRARYLRDSQSSASSLDRDGIGGNLRAEFSNRTHPNTDEDAPPPAGGPGPIFPTLVGVADIIAVNIPSLAGIVSAIGDPAPSAIVGSPPSIPLAPPSLDSMADSIAANIPSLAEAASTAVNPSVPADTKGTASLDSIVSSLAGIPSLAGIVNDVANPTISSAPSAPPLPEDKLRPPSLSKSAGDAHIDIGLLSQLVTSALDPTADVVLRPVQSPAKSRQEAEEGLTPPSHTKEENPYVTLLGCWTSQEEADTESSNEEEEPGISPAFSGPPGLTEEDPASTNTINVSSNDSGRPVPKRPAPLPPHTAGQSQKTVKHKIPRAATIRVSRKKGGSGSSGPQSAVVRASWLDVWKGFRHSVLWATLDGQLMSLWKKRTDRFSEVLFHVSSITNVKKQDKGRFSVYFRKKHYDFMAHNDEVQDGWITSLLATRGQPSPAPPELDGPITIKDPRSRAYAALWGHDLWIYPNKEGFQLGIASFSVPLNLATVKSTGKHSFSLITPYRSFSLSVDSSKDLSVWLDSLSSTIRSALSCSQVALRLWENPCNKVCGDCAAANPEWASVNLLLIICQNCAGQHRALGSNLSKVRSLKMDNKVWTEPLIQLFVTYGNRLANQVWAPEVPATEQLRPESTDEERSQFIQNKYSRGRYRRVHALTSSPSMMDQRLCQVVCSNNIEETMSLICSGAKVSPSDPQSPSPILLAERANQAMQTELLRLNEYTEVPPHLPQSAKGRLGSTPSGEEEELHGKLEDDRFLFSLENDSAACDVLDLREVLSVFLTDGPTHQFEMVTLSDQLICKTDDKEALQTHLVHILKVILPGGVSYAEVGGACAVSKVCVVEVGGASSHPDAWLLLWEDGVSVHPVQRRSQQPLRMELSTLTHHEMNLSESIITMATKDRSVAFRFEEQHSCRSWFSHLQRALANQGSAPPHPAVASQDSVRKALYPVMDVGARGSVPAAVERCISHVTTYGLKVEGVYRRCGLATKVDRLVEALMTSPNSAPLEGDEQGVLDAASALKKYVRQRESLIPKGHREQWLQAAVIPDERCRFKEYRRLLRQLPDDNRATLNALFGHFYMVQVFSQVNRMSAHNLAVVLVPSLFQNPNQDLIRLTREFIIHHTLLFLTLKDEEEEEDEITAF